jgi:tripartite-type tricarboxylate transporter receptor subunit TctC
MVKRRHILRLVAAAAIASSASAGMALAEPAYPTRPVRVIVPFPAGGGTDILARLIAQKLSERLGQQFYVENIAGAGGSNGTAQAAKAAPDGHTVLFAFSSFVVNPSLFSKLLYDPIKDFEPVTLAAVTTTVLITHPSIPAANLRQLGDFVRANPGKHSFASGGFGTQAHLVGEQLRLALNIDMAHVPFTGAGPSVVSVVGGHTPIGLTSLAAGLPQIKDGKVRALVVTSKARSKALPDVPTMADAGHPGIIGDSWVGVLVPAGTPKDITATLYREIVQIVSQPVTKDRLSALGFEPVANTPQQFAADIKAEMETWAKVIVAANIKTQ